MDGPACPSRPGVHGFLGTADLIEELSLLGTDRIGSHAVIPRRDRDDAIRRFEAWSRSNRA